MMENEKTTRLYMKDINKYGLLTRKEEYDLATKVAKGDKEAKNKLIEGNLRFVVQVAKRYRNCGLPMSDLINEGNLGLIKAAESFDRKRGFHFISYAVYWIKQSILKAVSEKSKVITIPLNKNNNILQIDKIINNNFDSSITNDNYKEIKDNINIKKKEVTNLFNISKKYISLDSMMKNSKSNKKRFFRDLVEDTSDSFKPEPNILNQSLRSDLEHLLTTLSEQERKVINLRFGLTNKGPMTLQEVGNIMNLTKERIRQIEKKALKRLKHPSRKNRLKAYMS